MTIWTLIWMIAGLGALGGLANCFITGEFALPQFDSAKRVWRPGWIGNVIIGAIAAVVVGGMYGPLAHFVVTTKAPQEVPPLTVAQLLGAIVVGLGGGNILTQMALRQADRLAKDNLMNTVAGMTKTSVDGSAVTPAVPPKGEKK